MLYVFFHAVLPIFAAVAIGYFFGWRKIFDGPAAFTLNRFVFYLALPTLAFHLVATAPFEKFDWSLVVAFLATEAALYALGFAVARYVFARPVAESLLLGMAMAFVNQVFFVLPIAQQLFGDRGTLPIIAITTFDVLVIFIGTMMLLDAMSNRGEPLSVRRVLQMLMRNPPIIGIAAGAFLNLSGAQMPEGLSVFSRFIGAAAAPCSLFALGLILWTQKEAAGVALPACFTGIKLVVMPAVAWMMLTVIFQINAVWAGPAMLVAAGPAGAMPFILALQYRVPVAAIARVILLTTVGSLITVTVAAQL